MELSQEYEALAFIRENSIDSPDLLPGLCLYSENWLQSEVFPHFRDLKNRQASLKEYFADDQVQAYLEALPRDNQTNRQSNPQPQSNNQNNQNTQSKSNSNVVYRQFNNRRQTPPGYAQQTSSNAPAKPTDAVTPNETPVSVGPLPTAERFRSNNRVQNGSARAMTTTGVPGQTNGRKRRKQTEIPNSGVAIDGTPRPRVARRRAAPSTQQKRTRFIWLVFGSLSGLLVLWLLVGAAVGLLQNIFSPEPTSQAEQLSIQINEAPIEIPTANSEPISDNAILTKGTAKVIVENWLSTKASALGENHNIESLDNILVGTALNSWRIVARTVKAKNRYRTFEHTVNIESVDTIPNNKNQAAIEATVTEQASFYQNGQLNQARSYNDNIRVRYMVVKIGGKWRIKDMTVISKT